MMDMRQQVKKAPVPTWIIFLLASACGLIVANLYYAQTVIGPISMTTGLSSAAAGLIVTLTQIGYVIGLLFIVPLSDITENRRLVVLFLIVLVVALIAAAFSPTICCISDCLSVHWYRFCCRSNSGALCDISYFRGTARTGCWQCNEWSVAGHHAGSSCRKLYHQPLRMADGLCILRHCHNTSNAAPITCSSCSPA